MPQEYSAGAVVFHRAGNTIKYLLLRYISEATGQPSYWGFTKGHIEPGETLKQTAAREIKEETSLVDIVFVNDVIGKNEYFFRRKQDDGRLETVHKEVVYYLAESKSDQVVIPPESHEHCDFAWLEYEEAVERLTHESSKAILSKAKIILSH